jgi:hypothetical protein
MQGRPYLIVLARLQRMAGDALFEYHAALDRIPHRCGRCVGHHVAAIASTTCDALFCMITPAVLSA